MDVFLNTITWDVFCFYCLGKKSDLFCVMAEVSSVDKLAIYLSLISCFPATNICFYFCFTEFQ